MNNEKYDDFDKITDESLETDEYVKTTSEIIDSVTKSTEEKKEQEKVASFDIKTMIVQCIRKNELKNIIVFKDRTMTDDRYSYLSKFTGEVKTCKFNDLVTKIREELFNFEWYQKDPIELVKQKTKEEEGYNLVRSGMNFVDGVTFDPQLEFGKTRNQLDKAFVNFNTYKFNPLKERLLAEIEELRNMSREDYLAEIALDPKQELPKTAKDLFYKMKAVYPRINFFYENALGKEKLGEKNFDLGCIWVLNWQGKAVRPEDGKCGTAIVIRGEQGSGKSTIFEQIMKPILTKFNVVNGQALKDSFKDNIPFSDFCLAEEVELVDKGAKDAYAFIKEVITQDYVNIRRMRQKGENFKVSANWAFVQNPVTPLHYEINERRMSHFDSNDGNLLPKIEKEFGIKDGDIFYEEMRNEERDCFLRDLLAIDYDNAMIKRVFVTEGKLRLTEQTNKSESVIANYIKKEEYHNLFDNGYITSHDVDTTREKLDVAKFYIEIANGYLTTQSRKIFAYFSLLHKKSNSAKPDCIDRISEKQAKDVIDDTFSSNEKKKQQVTLDDGSKLRPSITKLNPKTFDVEKLKESLQVQSSEIEVAKKFFEIIKVNYESDEEFKELCLEYFDSDLEVF